MKKIILASGSPRRRELMEQVGLDFQVISSSCSEDITAQLPEELAGSLSALKCRSVADAIRSGSVIPDNESPEGYLVIGADTIVVHDNKVLGKPKDADDAFNMLKSLSGCTHTVYTGVTVSDTVSLKEETFVSHTMVTMFSLNDREIMDYIATGEPMDKAGAYGIQGRGAALVKEISGDYFTVVGLPVAQLLRVLKHFV